jgi:virginiamycin B lyase
LAIGAAFAGMCGCGGDTDATSKASPSPKRQVIDALRLPRGAWPSDLAFDARGTMWISESSADAVAERRPDGRILQHRLGTATNTSVGDIVPGPDGNMWFQGFQLLGWVTPQGKVSGYELGNTTVPIGDPSAMTQGPDGNVWFTRESRSPAVMRIDAARSFRTYPLPSGEGGLDLGPIAAGQDGAIWFAQQASDPDLPPEALGRIEPSGRYTRIPFDHERVGVAGMAGGSDGAMWITERSRYSIARVTADGKIREFRLRPGTVPGAIILGRDKALWFTTETGVGRITTHGAITSWPIPGAKDLASIVQAPDRSFWVTDPSISVVHHFRPSPR